MSLLRALTIVVLGSTAYPKPVPFTRRGLLNMANTPRTFLNRTSRAILMIRVLTDFGDTNLTGKRIAAHTNPIFRKGYFGLC